MILDKTWIVPQAGVDWLRWGFGTRHSVLRNELASAQQVHGNTVLSVIGPGIAGEADALVTAQPGLLLGIKTADCLPILLADTNRRVVAAVHAGWRGTAQGIVGETIHHMNKNFGTKPNDLLVALGPCIRKCCFEVGPEVAKEFAGFQSELGTSSKQFYLDLQAINEWQLASYGVPKGNIMHQELCTVCEQEKFWSFRRERGTEGRMWSVVGIEK